MAYRMARLSITLSEAECHFCCLNLCSTHNSANIASFCSVFLHTNWKARVAFYRAMHYSAKRGLAIACRLSVRVSVGLSVCL